MPPNAQKEGRIAALATFFVWQVLWAVTREPGAGKSWIAATGFTAFGIVLGLLVQYGVTNAVARRADQ